MTERVTTVDQAVVLGNRIRDLFFGRRSLIHLQACCNTIAQDDARRDGVGTYVLAPVSAGKRLGERYDRAFGRGVDVPAKGAFQRDNRREVDDAAAPGLLQ